MATKKATKSISKFDYKKIKTFEDACERLNIDPASLPDVSMIPEEFRKPIIAVYKLMIIFKAINNGWVANYGDSNQWKYYPWFYVVSSGVGFSGSGCDYADTHATVGSRLCTDSREKALYIAKQFEAEYRDFILYPEEVK
jgi:hypothetical protein